MFDTAIVTKVERGKSFYSAEDYHQDCLAQNSHDTCILINDLPKVRALEKFFPKRNRKEPMLVS
ncbi:peptide-methionine (S)-S-oxide reductase [Hyphomicrobium sp.]|uniref:peptide-methionine (S)-S-oxide reductase n=1 Tax=Hyphomicrobium sp. TaxID=82 RepID=UPI003FA57C34